MNDLIEKIHQWSIDRGLDKQNASKQMIKLVEEVGELAGGHNKQNISVVKDSLGDMFVVMVIFCQQMGLDIQECVELAVKEISDRKGKMVDGVFVKEADLDFYNVRDRI